MTPKQCDGCRQPIEDGAPFRTSGKFSTSGGGLTYFWHPDCAPAEDPPGSWRRRPRLPRPAAVKPPPGRL